MECLLCHSGVLCVVCLCELQFWGNFLNYCILKHALEEGNCVFDPTLQYDLMLRKKEKRERKLRKQNSQKDEMIVCL